MVSLPSLFLAHGAPDLPLTEHKAKRFLNGLAAQLIKPRAILIVSAHWEETMPTLTTAPTPVTIHDFMGWPEPLYDLQYPAHSDTVLIERTKKLLAQAGFPIKEDAERGFDHGAWVPLLLTYPDANIPVVQLSLQRGGDPRQHFRIGEALAPLRDEGVLIIGSGATVHNLGALAAEGTPAPDWAKDFDHWLNVQLAERKTDQLLEFPKVPAGARQAHPTIEHFMPIFVAMGAGWAGGHTSLLHQSYSYGSLGMACYAFGNDAEMNTVGGQIL